MNSRTDLPVSYRLIRADNFEIVRPERLTARLDIADAICKLCTYISNQVDTKTAMKSQLEQRQALVENWQEIRRLREALVNSTIPSTASTEERISKLFDLYHQGLISRSDIKRFGKVNEWELREWNRKLGATKKALFPDTN